MVTPRCVFKGVRNIAQQKLKDLPKDGLSGKYIIWFFEYLISHTCAGEWQKSVSPKGFVTRDLHLDVLRDLDKYLLKRQIDRPVWLFMDGASPHISLDALEFCRRKNIQPFLFKPNMTHLLEVKTI